MNNNRYPGNRRKNPRKKFRKSPLQQVLEDIYSAEPLKLGDFDTRIIRNAKYKEIVQKKQNQLDFGLYQLLGVPVNIDYSDAYHRFFLSGLLVFLKGMVT